jgi:hypothetical protein
MTTLLIAYSVVSGTASVFVIFAGWHRTARNNRASRAALLLNGGRAEFGAPGSRTSID